MVFNRQRRIPLAVGPLEVFLSRVRSVLGLPPEAVAVRLVSDRAIARWNLRYRGKRGPTDVLSFPVAGRSRKLPIGGGMPGNGKCDRIPPRYLGDIAISPATARRNARRLRRPLLAELRALILHGVLHLAGYDHESDRGEMARLERRLRRRLGLS